MTDDRGDLDLTKVIDDSNELIAQLRYKLKAKCDEVLKLRKQLDYEKEEHQLTELKYNKLKDAIDTEINNRLNTVRKGV